MAKIHIKSEKLILFGVFFRLWRNYLLFRKSVIIRDVILIDIFYTFLYFCFLSLGKLGIVISKIPASTKLAIYFLRFLD